MRDEDFAVVTELGEKAQRKAVELLKNEFPTIRSTQGKVSGYDLIDDNGYKFEIKFDILSKKTNNIAIEFRSNGFGSGISVTTSDEWLHIFFYKSEWVYFRCKVLDLKRFIKSNFEYLKTVRGGYNNLSEMVLIHKEWIADNFGIDKV